MESGEIIYFIYNYHRINFIYLSINERFMILAI